MFSPYVLRRTYYVFPLCVVILLISTNLNAQDLNDEMKERLRRTIILPENKPDFNPLYHNPRIINEYNDDILEVSPFTKLPSKYDRIQLIEPINTHKIHINFNTSVPINQRPAGSVRYEFVGSQFMMISTAGQRVNPLSFDSGPIRKRHKRGKNILRAFEK